VHRQRVGNGEPGEFDRLGQDRDVFNGIDRDAELVAQIPEVFDGAQLKFPLSGLCGLYSAPPEIYELRFTICDLRA
jgi:hypothetical protein